MTIEIYFKAIQKTMRVYYFLAKALPIPRGIDENADIEIRKLWIRAQEDQNDETLLADISFPSPDDPEFSKKLSEQFRIFFGNVRRQIKEAMKEFKPTDQSADGDKTDSDEDEYSENVRTPPNGSITPSDGANTPLDGSMTPSSGTSNPGDDMDTQ